ncbi:acetyl-CoA synthetase-like protein [Artomyces pyxidatus]|uniref:Acetyl-CoA synthetase-like protein n=1 Tax=Artomyces pyxidatus TaxID=48021 RepID=A0ACB8THD4_9AGAM|nr:acetyl-CoA synthetase-like protein [Artomyces pyxidatus]
MSRARFNPHRSSLPEGPFCSTFRPPLPDGSLAFAEMVEYHAQRSPEHPLFVFADSGTTRTITYSEAWRMVKRAATILRGRSPGWRSEGIHPPDVDFKFSDERPTIGILATVDTISYFAAVTGTMRLGFVPFPISVRNSPAGVAHLVKSSRAVQLLVSPDPAMQRLSADAASLLEQDGILVEVLPMIQFGDISDEGYHDGEPNITFPKLVLDSVACLMHSSGSTAFPKIIPVSNRTLTQFGTIPLHGQVDFCCTIMGVHTSPVFHVIGLAVITMAVTTGMILSVFKPSSPPVTPTPERYLNDILATKTSVICCVPSLIEAWFEDPANISLMAGFKAVLYGGASMNRDIGEQLVKMGIALSPFYGMTETTYISMFIQKSTPTVDNWEYFKLAPHLELEMLQHEELDNVFELVVVRTSSCEISVINSSACDGREAYRTNDLLERHPNDPSLWKIYGRTDDQIILSNGEKTNPVPLEAMLARDPRIAAAVMFGRGRFQNGVLIEPKHEFTFDPEDEQQLADFRNNIWPTVEKLNLFAPTHSRLFKEMILPSSPSKPFSYTAKGTPRRHVIIKAYKREIDALYNAVEQSSQAAVEPPSSWTRGETITFMRSTVERVIRRNLPDDADLFQEGCDSLQATSIRNSIIHALRCTSHFSFDDIPNSFVYDNPTISSLCDSILQLAFRNHAQVVRGVPDRAQSMTKMLEKHSRPFPTHTPRLGSANIANPDEVVLLTGSTGRLGCHLLAQLLRRPSVTKMYALNRLGGVPIRERHRQAFERWRLDISLLQSPKLEFLEGDMARRDLGLAADLIEKLRDSATFIIHNAWRLDFNIPLASFEPLISSVRSLIDLALGSPHLVPPPILYTSSISVAFGQVTQMSLSEVPITDPGVSVATGYSESKWVAESLLLRAMQRTGLRVNVVRVGQLCGDSISGGWNEKEWVAAMMRGSQVLGAVPQRDEMISWIPVDIAASALLEMLGCGHPVLHLVHPNPVEWSILSEAASSFLQVPSIPYAAWIAKLQDAHRKSATDTGAIKDNPALKLFDFFSTMAGKTWPGLDVERAVEASSTLRAAARLERQDVERWMAYWRAIDFLQA